MFNKPLNRIQSNKPVYISVRRPCTISTGIVIARWGIYARFLNKINIQLYKIRKAQIQVSC
jgi:hypothetical protein